LAALLLLSCGTLAGCASRSGKPDGSPLEQQLELHRWQVARGETFTAYTNAPGAHARRSMRRVDRFVEVAGHLLYGRAFSPSRPLDLYLFRDSEQFQLFAPEFARGHASRLDDRSFLALGLDHGLSTGVLYHELLHVVLFDDSSRNYPRWFHEGLAEFFSTSVLRDDVLTIGRAPALRVDGMRLHSPIPLARLLDGPGAGSEIDDVFRYYADAWVFIHYALLGERGGGEGGRNLSSLSELRERMRGLRGLARLLHDGADLQLALPQAFGESMKAIEAGYERYRSFILDSHVRTVWHFTIPLREDRLDFQPTEMVEIVRALARYAEHTVDDEPIVAELWDIALAAEPTDPVALQGRVRAAARDGDLALAREIWARLPEVVRSSRSACWTAGSLAHAEYASSPGARSLEAAYLEEARDRYRCVLESSPNRLSVLAALGETYVLEELAKPQPGIVVLERVLELQPGVPSVRLDLAILLLRAGEVESARVHLEYVVERYPKSELASRARSLLKEAR
jgi:tetratricopeptide (TPR) repeat protein